MVGIQNAYGDGGAAMASRTYVFDNCRFLAPRSQGGSESGSRGWVRICAKGRRETLPGIEPGRTALVVVDMQQGCVHGMDVDYAELADDPTEPVELRTAARELRAPNITPPRCPSCG